MGYICLRQVWNTCWTLARTSTTTHVSPSSCAVCYCAVDVPT